MSKQDKLIEKLKRLKISADDLRTLLKKLGWVLDDTEGSHEQWYHPSRPHPNNRFTLSTHGKDVKMYQLREAREKLIDEE